ncbi:MAG: SdrD B-like domain-containing protein, partial [Saprospiraceae bacterium]
SGGDGTGNPQYPGGLDDNNVNETVDFGFRLEKVAVGNYVFMDNDNDGIYSVGDMPIPLVDVWLYPAGANYGVDAPLMTDITNPDGYYYFDSLYPGQYVVFIPASNFLLGAALDSKESYPGADAGNGDNNDNGQDGLVNGGVRSNALTLTPNAMPTNEPGAGGSGTGTPAYPGGLDDNNVNETVDFTFRCVNPLPDILADITVNTDPDVCTAVVTYNVNIVTTPSGNLTVNYEFTGATTGSGQGTGSGSTFNLGETTITITATNACTTVVRVFTITVLDVEPPKITCPPDVTVQCMPGNDNATATDNCSVLSVELLSMVYLDPPMMCVTGRRLVRTFIATDGSGNTATCSHTITLKDDIKPTFTFVPANVTVQCNSVPPPGTPTASDNCAGKVTITYDGQNKTNGSCTDSYTLLRQWTATDACGNTRTATQRITVIDTQKPAFVNPPANLTVQCNAIPNPNAPVATDNCDPDVAITYVGQTKTNGSCPNAYTLTRRWVATDNCNNTVSISQRITVVDNVKPVFTWVPGNLTLTCTDAIPSVGTPTASDACGGTVVVTYLGAWNMNATCPGNYQIMRQWKATDVCGNVTTAGQIISIQDKVAPSFTSFPSNVTVQCNQTPPAVANPVAADGCGGQVSVTYLGQVRTNGSCLNNYLLTRTWRAADLCGNSTTRAQVITVQDTQAPNFTSTPANVTVVCAPNCVPPPPVVTATDNCGTATVTLQQVQTTGDCSTGYTVTRTWTATDACGNAKKHTQVFTVLPAPTFGPTSNDPVTFAGKKKTPTEPTVDRAQGDGSASEQNMARVKDISLTPNPTSDWVNIGLKDFAGEPVVVLIYNELGQAIWEQRIPAVEESVLRVNLRQAGIAAGLHTVAVRSGGQVYAKRLILME